MLKQSTVTAATQSAARLTSWDIHETSALYSTTSCYNKHLLLTVFHLQPRGAYLSERSQTLSALYLFCHKYADFWKLRSGSLWIFHSHTPLPACAPRWDYSGTGVAWWPPTELHTSGQLLPHSLLALCLITQSVCLSHRQTLPAASVPPALHHFEINLL